MKFIVDAQLPDKLKDWLTDRGFDTIHTNDLPEKHLTSDQYIINIADRDNRIVISKDSDFYKSNLIEGKPVRLLFVTTGNIVNKALIKLFELNFLTIKHYFDQGHQVIELDNISIILH